MKIWSKIVIAIAVIIAAIITIGIYSNREVVNAFEKINQKLDKVNKLTQFDNNAIINTIQNDSLLAKSILLRETTLAFNNYVESLKVTLLKGIDGNFEKGNKETNIFFDKSQITEEGRRFLTDIQEVRLALVKNTTAGDTLLLNKIDDLCTLTDVDNQDKSESGLRYHFERFPVISVVAKLTSIQSDIQAIEKQILVGFVSQETQSIQ
ncbi:MAG: hypothetical protein ACI9Y7_000534 [Dokdonia sp.]